MGVSFYLQVPTCRPYLIRAERHVDVTGRVRRYRLCSFAFTATAFHRENGGGIRLYRGDVKWDRFLLVTVNWCAGLVVPSGCEPKSKLLGVSVTSSSAVPLRGTVIGQAGAPVHSIVNAPWC